MPQNTWTHSGATPHQSAPPLPPPAQPRLNYRLMGRTAGPDFVIHGELVRTEIIAVEWRHDAGPIGDRKLVPVDWRSLVEALLDGDGESEHVCETAVRRAKAALGATPHANGVVYEEVIDGAREVIHDSVSVKAGTPDSIVAMILEENRAKLAKNLGVDP